MTPTRMQTAVTGPVFIVGCPRSGTTLLQRMLDAHADVAIAPETHFIRRFWLQRASYGDLRDDSALRRLIENVVEMPEFAEMALNADEFHDRAAGGERSYAAIFWLLLSQFAKNRGARVVGEKTPNHVLYMPILQRFFPAALFVHIVRDARAVVNSWRHVPWSTGTLAGDAEVWRRYLATARRRAPTAGMITTVRYEGLLVGTEATLRALCAFLRLEFDAAMLAHERAQAETINVTREPWKSNATRQLDPAALDRWREELRPDQVQEIEAVAWGEMRRASYAPETGWMRLTPGAALCLMRRTRRRLRHRLAAWLR